MDRKQARERAGKNRCQSRARNANMRMHSSIFRVTMAQQQQTFIFWIAWAIRNLNDYTHTLTQYNIKREEDKGIRNYI